MEIIHGYQLVSDWKNSQCGKTARAKKGGRTYFLKKYQTPVEPVMNGALDKRTFDANKKKFEQFVSRRTRINKSLRTIAGEGGNIVIPREEFVDDHHYVEAAEFVDGAISDDSLERVLESLSPSIKRLLMLTATGALVSVHRLGIVHSDLKLKNVLLARNKSGNYVAKLIDFDSSYFLDDIPDEVVGDINYYSPELGNYANAEDDRDEYRGKLTQKSDIFSLGIVFHRYLAGSLPEPETLTEKLKKRKDKGKPVYCWTVMNHGCELKVSDKIDDINTMSLINDMLLLSPESRPSSTEVLKRLKSTENACVIELPWEEHGIVIDEVKLRAAGYVSVKRTGEGADKKYLLMTSNGKKEEKTPGELMASGFARKARPEIFCEPWEGHEIVINVSKLKSRGFICLEQKTLSGIKGYEAYRPDDSSQFFSAEKLTGMGFAEKQIKRIAESFCEPWPIHNIEFDVEQIKKRGFASVVREELGGVKGYAFIKPDGTRQFIQLQTVIILKMAKRR